MEGDRDDDDDDDECLCVSTIWLAFGLFIRSGESYGHNSKKPRKGSLPAAKYPEEK